MCPDGSSPPCLSFTSNIDKDKAINLPELNDNDKKPVNAQEGILRQDVKTPRRRRRRSQGSESVTQRDTTFS
jgi:hypothetical protein